MITETVKINPAGDFTAKELESLSRAGEIIKKGGLVAFPTETVYGLGGNALDPEASKKI